MRQGRREGHRRGQESLASDAKGPSFAFTPKDWYLALAAEVPRADGKPVANTAKTWKDVRADLPEWPIAVFIPGEKHGTREVFEEKLLHAGCTPAAAWLLDAWKKGGLDMRQGPQGRRSGRHRRRLHRDARSPAVQQQGIGVFGLSFYENNTDKIKVATVGGVTPSVETVATGKYPVSRPLFFYVKKAHLGVIPVSKEYVEFFIRPHDRRQGSARLLRPGAAARQRAQGRPWCRQGRQDHVIYELSRLAPGRLAF